MDKFDRSMYARWCGWMWDVGYEVVLDYRGMYWENLNWLFNVDVDLNEAYCYTPIKRKRLTLDECYAKHYKQATTRYEINRIVAYYAQRRFYETGTSLP